VLFSVFSSYLTGSGAAVPGAGRITNQKMGTLRKTMNKSVAPGMYY
jgi:hypothetical protein